ncbi:At1g47710 [Linum grandiflorum]
MDFSIRVAMKTILDQIQDGGNVEAAKNIVVSPASLDILLRTVACGTKGETLDQLLGFLGAQDIHDLNAKAFMTMEVLRLASPENSPPNYGCFPPNDPANVSCANAVWIDGGCCVKNSFKKVLADVYRAGTNSVDFLQKDEAVEEINSWAEKSTNGCVKKFLTPDDIKDGTVLVLTNAIYFKAFWSSKFDKTRTDRVEDFHLLDGTNTVSIPFMRKGMERFGYARFEEFKILELPYQTGRGYNQRDKGPCFAMYFFLPHKVDGLPGMLRKFDGSTEELLQALDRLEHVTMQIAIPKWKSSYKFSAKETMNMMGLNLPFEKNGDFTEMLDNGNLCITDVIHSAYIGVDESGTEAGAASAAMSGMYGMLVRPEEFVADHPFMYMIVERVSKAVIFTGAVFNPLDQE